MSRCLIEIEADRVELGELVPGAGPGEPLHQTVRLFEGGTCVCRVSVVYLTERAAASARFIDGREAGERD